MSGHFSKIKLSENQIQKQCIDYLRSHRWFLVENYKNVRPRVKGVSDITAIRKGRHLWIEFKTYQNDQSTEQIEFEMAIKNHGAEYIVVRSLDELIVFLDDTTGQGELFK